MADLHDSMGLSNLLTGTAGSGPINARRRREIHKPDVAPQSNQGQPQKPDMNEIMKQLGQLQGESEQVDPTGNLQTTRSENG